MEKIKIVITKRPDDYHACIEGHPELWGCGNTSKEAIGNLIYYHNEAFNLEIDE